MAKGFLKNNKILLLNWTLNHLMEQIIEIGEYKIFTKLEGEGPALLLLHSYWGNLCLFDKLAASLSMNNKVIRIDLPGHGKSGNPPPDYTFDNFALILSELLIRLNVLEKISIIGHSMGGYVAMAFAAAFPQKTAVLILMHAPLKSADDHSIKLRNREKNLLLRGKIELMLQLTVTSNFAPENIPKMRKEIALLFQTADQVTLEGALSTIYALNHRSSYFEVLQSAQYPVLIIIGKYDKVYRADEQIDDASKIPDARVLVLDHSGHMGFMEEENLVLTNLKEFLQTH
ncbi:MAG: alpha/beta hydrolase [Mariniphaga sp.]